MLNADGSAITAFTLNDDKTTFQFDYKTLQLTWSQQNVYNTAGSYIFRIKGTLADKGSATVDVPFKIKLSCKGSPISWAGSSDVFKNLAYTLLDPGTETHWTWQDVND